MNRHRTRSALIALVVALVATAALATATLAHSPRFPNRIALPNGWQPEGITAGRGTTVYVGSLATGGIFKANVRTGAGRVLVTSATGQAVGTEFENRANRLWVAGGLSGDVRVYNASSGMLLRTYSFGMGGFLNDLVVTRRAVYITDSSRQRLDVIPLGPHGALCPESAAFTLPLTGDFTLVPDQFNANGIVASRGWLILCQSITGQLFRVNPSTGVTKRINLGTANATNCDGLEVHGSTLYVVQNFSNRVAVFRLGSRLTSARLLRTLTSASLDIPTTAAYQAGRLYVANARFTTVPVTPDTQYWITKLNPRH